MWDHDKELFGKNNYMTKFLDAFDELHDDVKDDMISLMLRRNREGIHLSTVLTEALCPDAGCMAGSCVIVYNNSSYPTCVLIEGILPNGYTLKIDGEKNNE